MNRKAWFQLIFVFIALVVCISRSAGTSPSDIIYLLATNMNLTEEPSNYCESKKKIFTQVFSDWPRKYFGTFEYTFDSVQILAKSLTDGQISRYSDLHWIGPWTNTYGLQRQFLVDGLQHSFWVSMQTDSANQYKTDICFSVTSFASGPQPKPLPPPSPSAPSTSAPSDVGSSYINSKIAYVSIEQFANIFGGDFARGSNGLITIMLDNQTLNLTLNSSTMVLPDGSISALPGNVLIVGDTLLMPARVLAAFGCDFNLPPGNPNNVNVTCMVHNDAGEPTRLQNLLIRF